MKEIKNIIDKAVNGIQYLKVDIKKGLQISKQVNSVITKAIKQYIIKKLPKEKEERIIDYDGCTIKFLEDMNKEEKLAYDLGYNHATYTQNKPIAEFKKELE